MLSGPADAPTEQGTGDDIGDGDPAETITLDLSMRAGCMLAQNGISSSLGISIPFRAMIFFTRAGLSG